MSISRNPGKWKKSNICVAADYKKSVMMPEKVNHKTAPVHLTSPQLFTMNKNFLLALVNPTDEISAKTRTYIRISANSCEKVTVSVFNPKDAEILSEHTLKRFFGSKNKEELLNLKHLPTLAEFKILLALLHYAQQEKSVALEFDSIADMIRHIGLTEGVENYKQVFMSLFNFAHLVIQYHSNYKDNYYSRSDSKTYRLTEKADVWGYLVLRGVGIDGEKVRLEFDAEFLEECGKQWVQDLHIEKISKIKSPKTMQLYLWLLSWSKRRYSNMNINFDRQNSIDVNFLFDELGWRRPEEGSVWLRPGRMLQQVNKCMDEIIRVDPGFKDFETLLENKKFCFQKRPVTSNVE